jgi:hypothetical protein
MTRLRRGCVLAAVVAAFIGPAVAQELCGRPSESPEALFDRLTKTEKLKEDFRDKSYVAISDKAKETVWTFTVPGHPAHPSVVCRRPVQHGDNLKLETNVRCNAAEAECEKLVKAFQELNHRMMQELKKQQDLKKQQTK